MTLYSFFSLSLKKNQTHGRAVLWFPHQLLWWKEMSKEHPEEQCCGGSSQCPLEQEGQNRRGGTAGFIFVLPISYIKQMVPRRARKQW